MLHEVHRCTAGATGAGWSLALAVRLYVGAASTPGLGLFGNCKVALPDLRKAGKLHGAGTGRAGAVSGVELKFDKWMKFLVLSLIFLATAVHVLAQAPQITTEQLNSSGASKLYFAADVERAQELAQEDIQRKLPFLLLRSGEAPVVYMQDSIFERKYQVFYYEYGCLAPDQEFMEAYNAVVFDHLEEHYGRKWKSTIRKDVVGLKSWKKEN